MHTAELLDIFSHPSEEVIESLFDQLSKEFTTEELHELIRALEEAKPIIANRLGEINELIFKIRYILAVRSV